MNLTYLFFICAVVVLLFGCGSERNTEAPAYRIAYNVLFNPENDNYEIFSMNMDGSDKKNITNHPALEWTYYANEDKILFISDRDTCRRCYFLYEMNPAGENVRKIGGARLADSWMSTRKNGSEIIVTPHRSVDSSFHIIDLQGNLLEKLQAGLPAAYDPLFVNEGRQVVFRGGRTKSKLIEGFNEELYIINVDGTELKQLTEYPKDDTTAAKFAYHAGPPILHPTENFVSYQSMQKGKYSLYAVTLDGQKQWKLTENPQNEGWHAWSPDGRWLAVEVFDDEQTRFHIGLMNWETKEMNILTDTTYQFQQSPVFVNLD